jgi:hypothetical protein
LFKSPRHFAGGYFFTEIIGTMPFLLMFSVNGFGSVTGFGLVVYNWKSNMNEMLVLCEGKI